VNQTTQSKAIPGQDYLTISHRGFD